MGRKKKKKIKKSGRRKKKRNIGGMVINGKYITPGGVVLKPGSTATRDVSNWRFFKPVFNKKLCTKCGVCWMYCPEGAIDDELKVNYQYCKGCGICAKGCIFNAIRMVREDEDIDKKNKGR